MSMDWKQMDYLIYLLEKYEKHIEQYASDSNRVENVKKIVVKLKEDLRSELHAGIDR